jgi:hypothetical protein
MPAAAFALRLRHKPGSALSTRSRERKRFVIGRADLIINMKPIAARKGAVCEPERLDLIHALRFQPRQKSDFAAALAASITGAG